MIFILITTGSNKKFKAKKRGEKHPYQKLVFEVF
jgi:hypothetical protein